LETALESLEQLKSQFSILQWIGSSKDDKQRIVVLEEQVATLTKERRALQEALTRQLTLPSSFAPLPPAPLLTQPTVNTTAVTAPTAEDTIPREVPSTRRGKKRRAEEEADVSMDIDEGIAVIETCTGTLHDDHENYTVHKEETGQDEETTAGSAASKVSAEESTMPTTPVRRKPGRPKKNLEAATPEPPKPKRKYTRKEVKSSANATDYSQLEIRNISVNPLLPSVSNPLTCKSSSSRDACTTCGFQFLLDTS